MKVSSPASKNGLLCLLLALFIIVNCWVYVAGEDMVYIWDYRGYWTTWQQFSSLLPEHLLTWLGRNEHAIRSSDYNPMPVSLLFPFYMILGAGRFAYILALALVYISLSALLLACLMRSVFRQGERVFVLTLLLSVMFVPFWRPTLRGYPDIAGLVPLIGAVLFVFHTSLSQRVAVKKALLLGLILWAPFLLRRWYAYTVVTLYVTLPFLVLFYERHQAAGLTLARRVRNIVINFCYAGLTTAVFAYAFQSAMIRRILRTDYGDIYSAYQASFDYSIESTLHGIGLYILPFAALGLLLSLRAPGRNSSLLCWFSLANLLLSFYLFTRTQSPGIQHQLPFALWIFVMALVGINQLIIALKLRNAILLMAVLTLLSLGVMLNALYRGGPALSDTSKSLLPSSIYSMRVEHFDHYQRLANTLVSLTDNGEKFAVFSSSDRLSDDLMSTISESKLDDRLVRISQVDLRDKLRMAPFMIKYLVVADPVQLHLGGNGQDVVKFPAEALLKGENIGKAYKRLPQSFLLDSGVHAWIYEKQRNFTDDEIAAFLGRFYEHYPQWKAELEQSLEPVFLGADIKVGDQWGAFNLDDADTLSGHPGEHQPTISEFTWHQDHMVIRSVNTTCPQADGVVVTLNDLENGESLTVKVANGASNTIDMHRFIGDRIRFVLDKGENSACDSVVIKAH